MVFPVPLLVLNVTVEYSPAPATLKRLRLAAGTAVLASGFRHGRAVGRASNKIQKIFVGQSTRYELYRMFEL
jgi:hypothetical protein